MRTDAAFALGRLGDKRAVDSLILALEDENEDVRSFAVFALGKIGDPRAVEPIIQILEEERADWSTIGIALSRLRDNRAVEPLIEALKKVTRYIEEIKKENPSIELKKIDYEYLRGRWSLADTLGDLGDKKVVEPLLEVLDDEDPDLREIAAMALGKIGDKKAITIVLERMKDEEQEIKNAVEKALMEYKGKE